MNTVPVMISTKDLAYISDMYEWNFNIAKLAKHFSNEVNNTSVKEIVDKVYNLHKEICLNLTNILG